MTRVISPPLLLSQHPGLLMADTDSTAAGTAAVDIAGAVGSGGHLCQRFRGGHQAEEVLRVVARGYVCEEVGGNQPPLAIQLTWK